MGVVGVWRKEPAGGLDGRMGRLDGDLRGRQVPADQHVQVRNLAELGLHVCSPRMNPNARRPAPQGPGRGRPFRHSDEAQIAGREASGNRKGPTAAP